MDLDIRFIDCDEDEHMIDVLSNALIFNDIDGANKKLEENLYMYRIDAIGKPINGIQSIYVKSIF